MNRHLVLAAFLLVLPFTPTTAATPIERTMAEELLTLTRAEATLATMREQMVKLIDDQMSAMGLPDEDKASAAQFQKRVFDLVFDELSFVKLREEYVEAYVAVLTQEELAGLIAFYRSPIGQSFITKMPALMSQMMELSRSRMASLMPKIESMAREFAEDIDATSAEPRNED